MSVLYVTLPLPVGANSRRMAGGVRRPGQYVPVADRLGRPRLVTSRAAQQWRERAGAAVLIARLEQRWTVPDGDLEVRLHAVGSGSDVDSGSKLALDAVADGLGVDDRRIVRLVLEVTRSGAPCLLVEVQGRAEALRCARTA